MAGQLDESLALFRDRITDCIKSRKAVSVTTHTDCDGLAAGSIIATALARAGARFTVGAAREFAPGTPESLRADPRDFYVVADLGGGYAAEMDRCLGEDWLVLDHHQIPDSEMDNPRVINAWRLGMDGGTEVCAGSMAYLAAAALDERNEDLAPLAVVAALGDRQDRGERKSLSGRNAGIAQAAGRLGLVETDLDLLLAGRETRPLPDALAYTTQPFVEGLTWNRDACQSLLESAGVRLKDGGRWRVPAELAEDEKRAVIEAVAGYVPGRDAADMSSEMMGYTYTLPGEDSGGFLRDGREFAMMLNSCGRIGRQGAGMAVCMGDRGRALADAGAALSDYRGMIRGYMSILSSERWRTSESAACVMVNGEDVVPEAMTGTVSSLIAGSPRNSGKIVILRTRTGGNAVKFSSRKSPGCSSAVNLSDLMRAGAERFDGIGGGHDAAAGAKITKDKLDDFLGYLEANVADVQGKDSS